MKMTVLPLEPCSLPLARRRAPAHAETAVLAGGCFWGMESGVRACEGRDERRSGYAGGSGADASYDKVSSKAPAMPRR